MKATSILLFTVSVIIGVISCEIEKSDTNTTGDLILSKVDYKGCFTNNPMKSTQGLSEETDTVYYTIAGDTLKLNVIKNHNCCGLLKDSVILSPGKVNIFISDTCTENCLCYCMCDFHFQYSFTDFQNKNIHFLVHFRGLDESEYVLWKHTKFTDAPD